MMVGQRNSPATSGTTACQSELARGSRRWKAAVATLASSRTDRPKPRPAFFLHLHFFNVEGVSGCSMTRSSQGLQSDGRCCSRNRLHAEAAGKTGGTKFSRVMSATFAPAFQRRIFPAGLNQFAAGPVAGKFQVQRDGRQHGRERRQHANRERPCRPAPGQFERRPAPPAPTAAPAPCRSIWEPVSKATARMDAEKNRAVNRKFLRARRSPPPPAQTPRRTGRCRCCPPASKKP